MLLVLRYDACVVVSALVPALVDVPRFRLSPLPTIDVSLVPSRWDAHAHLVIPPRARCRASGWDTCRATSAITPLTPTFVVRALVLNGIAEVTFGHVYRKHRLEAAMTGHMSAHVVGRFPDHHCEQGAVRAQAFTSWSGRC